MTETAQERDEALGARYLDRFIHVQLMGGYVPTDEEMRETAERVWEIHPQARAFSDPSPFLAIPASIGAEFDPITARFSPIIPRYSEPGQERILTRVLDRMRARGYYLRLRDTSSERGRFAARFVRSVPTKTPEAEGSTFAGAICEAIRLALTEEMLNDGQ